MPSHKRTFDEFAEPFPPFQWGRPYSHNNKADGKLRLNSEPLKPNKRPLYNYITTRTFDQLNTVWNNYLRHGRDPETPINGLTNDIHPVFRNICRCKFTRQCFCLGPEGRYEFENEFQRVQVPEIASPAPSKNFVVRAMMQLATRLIVSDEALSFWSALMDCGIGGLAFHAHPRRHLSTEQKNATLRRLRLFATRIVIHFREFSHLHKRPFEDVGLIIAFTEKRRVRDGPWFAHIFVDVERINGYDFSASKSSYDQTPVGDLRRAIVCGAATLCHEVAHAFAFLQVQTELEPIFNNEPFAEVGHAFENFLFGGIVAYSPGGFWLRQWPPMGMLTGSSSRSFRRKPIWASNTRTMPGPQWVDEEVYARLLNDQHWEDEEVVFGLRRCKPFKKMWLRPYRESPMTPCDYKHFRTGYLEAPLRGNQAKRRRLAGTRGGCWRWEDNRRVMHSTIEKSRRVCWIRSKGKMEKRKEKFHERALQCLNQAWVELLNPFPVNTFLRASRLTRSW